MIDALRAASAMVAGYAVAIPLVSWPFVADQAERRHLRWFLIMAASLAAYSFVVMAAYDSLAPSLHDAALRISSLLASTYLAALLGLYGQFRGGRPARVDIGLFVALAAAAAYGLLSPGGIIAGDVLGTRVVDLGRLGSVYVAEVKSDPLTPAWRILALAVAARCAVLAWPSDGSRPDRAWWLLPPAAVIIADLWGALVWGRFIQGVPIANLMGTVIFALIGLECLKRLRALRAENLELAGRLGEEEAKVRALNQQAIGPAILLDPDGRVVTANRAAILAAVASGDGLSGSTLGDSACWSTQPKERGRLRAAIARAAHGEPDRFSVSLKAPSGKDGDFDFTVSPCGGTRQRPRHLLLEGRDTTVLRRYEERLRDGTRLETIGQLAAGIAHDFNNLLTGIIGSVELCRMHDTDGRFGKYLGTILTMARRSAALTGKLLAYARHAKAQEGPLSLNELVTETMGLFEHLSRATIRVETRLNARPGTVVGDAVELQSAILNLCVNARDAMPAGGELLVTTRNEELGPDQCAALDQAVAPGAYVVLEVADTGAGMSEEVRRRIFEPFFSTKDSGAGTGLGLAAVLGAVRAHDGAIEARSRLGFGTIFTIHLPAGAGASSSDGARDQPPPVERNPNPA